MCNVQYAVDTWVDRQVGPAVKSVQCSLGYSVQCILQSSVNMQSSVLNKIQLTVYFQYIY